MEEFQTNARVSYSLDNVPVLEHPEQYNDWLEKITAFFTFGDLVRVIQTETDPPTQREDQSVDEYRKSFEIWNRKSDLAKAAIKDRVSYNGKSMIKLCTTAASMMSTIRDYFRPRGMGVYTELCKRFNDITLGQYKNVTEYIEAFNRIDNEMKALDANLALPEPFRIQKLLLGLGEAYSAFQASFNQTRVVLATSSGETTVTFSITARLILDEEKRIQVEESMRAGANYSLVSSSSAPQKTGKHYVEVDHCDYCNKNYHREENCRKKHPHLQKQWDEQQKARTERRKKRKHQNSTEDEMYEAPTISALSAMPLHHNAPIFQGMSASIPFDLSDKWVVDSGANHSSTNNRVHYITYRKISGLAPFKGHGGESLVAVGLGTVRLSCIARGKQVYLELEDVYHCPSAVASLVSVHRLTLKGVKPDFTSDLCSLRKGNLELTATQQCGLYLLDLCEKPFISIALASYSITSPTIGLWHDRLGHLGENNVLKLQGMSTGMNLQETPTNSCACSICIVTRQKTKPHRHRIEPGRYPMELIHTDVIGPLPLGMGKYKYLVTFLEDYCDKATVYSITEKSQVFQSFKNYKEANERPDTPIQRIHRLRSDNGGEYNSIEFEAYRHEHGIQWEPSTADNPQQNGIAERLNDTLMTRTFALLKEANLDKKYWPLMAQTACYLRNRSPSSRIGKTPYEAWTGIKPSLSHLRRVGSDAWARVKGNTKIPKFQNRSVKCKLVGYEGDHIYILLGPDERVFKASNVHIDEKPSSRVEEHQSKRNNSHAATFPGEQPKKDEQLTDNHEERRSTVIITADTQPMVQINDGASTNTDSSSYLGNDTTTATHNGTRRDSPELEDTIIVQPVGTRTNPSVAKSTREPRSTMTLRNRKARQTYGLLSLAKEPERYEPKTYQQARYSSSWDDWKKALQSEMDSLYENNTWNLVYPPENRRILRGKWVFKVKRGADGAVIKYKARWVVKGFEQEEGVDYNETFASVVKPMSYKALFAIAAALDWEIEQMDVKTAFLYGSVKEDIYVEQPTGFADDSGKVCKLNRALYGLKQSPRIWYETLSGFLETLGYYALNADLAVFFNGKTFVTVFVDDLQIFGPNLPDINKLKRALNQRFQMTDLGPTKYYLGMEITRDRPNRTIRLSQRGYIEQVIKDFGFWNAKIKPTPMTQNQLREADKEYEADSAFRGTYQSAVGSLMYAMLGTRPDIAYTVAVLSRYCANPLPEHWTAVKHVFCYLLGSLDLDLVYSGNLTELVGYTDADWGGDRDTRRSTSGYIFNIGSGAISWSSKRQPIVALSTCEAEYIGQTQATKEAVWLRVLLDQITYTDEEEPQATIIYGDNQGALALAKNPEFHARTKHIDIQWHFVREKVADGTVQLKYIPTDQQVADILTKPLPKDKFLQYRKALGLLTRDPK
jgi:hypothetical protein